jgi:hypothetical protein
MIQQIIAMLQLDNHYRHQRGDRNSQRKIQAAYVYEEGNQTRQTRTYK